MKRDGKFTYEEGECFLELGDLLLGERVRLDYVNQLMFIFVDFLYCASSCGNS